MYVLVKKIDTPLDSERLFNYNFNIRNERLKERVERIISFYHEKGRMPSYSEVAEIYGFRSKNASFKLVEKLLKLGLLSKDEKARLINSILNQLHLVYTPYPLGKVVF